MPVFTGMTVRAAHTFRELLRHHSSWQAAEKLPFILRPGSGRTGKLSNHY